MSCVPESGDCIRVRQAAAMQKSHARKHAKSVSGSVARLFIARLSPMSTATSIRAYFYELLVNAGHMAPHEAITDVYMPLGPGRKSRGFAFLSLADEESVSMITAQPVHTIDGKVVVLDTAAPRDVQQPSAPVAAAPTFPTPMYAPPHPGMYDMIPVFPYGPYGSYWVPAMYFSGQPMPTQAQTACFSEDHMHTTRPDVRSAETVISNEDVELETDSMTPVPAALDTSPELPPPVVPVAEPPRRRMQVKRLSQRAFTSPTSSMGSVPTPIVQMIACALTSPA